MSQKQQKLIKWSARIIATGILIFALPFYFGYDNPLPFIKSDYSIWENVAVTMMPLVFISLALGWKYPKIGGWLVIASILTGFIVGLLTKANFSINLAVPIFPGILYLIAGYNKNETK
jgi:thiamine transporter ThiT